MCTVAAIVGFSLRTQRWNFVKLLFALIMNRVIRSCHRFAQLWWSNCWFLCYWYNLLPWYNFFVSAMGFGLLCIALTFVAALLGGVLQVSLFQTIRTPTTTYSSDQQTSWWRHRMETFSALLAIYEGNSPVTDEFPSQRPVTRSFDHFFDLRLNKTVE